MNKSGFINLIGRPNVGKSSILNYLIGMKLSIVTDKPQTTRTSMKFIYTDDRMQAIFLDNPGFQLPKNKLGDFMKDEVIENSKDSDINVYVFDNSLETGRLDNMVLELASKDSGKKICLINKSELLKEDERELLYTKYDDMNLFNEILFVSVNNGEGFSEFLDSIYNYLPEGPKFYDDDSITDVNIRDICSEILREKCLIHIREEIPHGIYVECEEFIEGEKVRILFNLYLERENHKSILIGKSGSTINKIIRDAEREISLFLSQKAKIKINIKIKKNWRKTQKIVSRWFK